MSRALHLVPKPAADLRLTVHVDPDSDLRVARFGDRFELTVADAHGHTAVTIDLPGAEFRRLVSALSAAWNGEQK